MTEALEIETDLVIHDFGILSFDESDEDDSLEPLEPKLSILDLPEEVLVQIISYISLYELYHSVALVSKLFCRISRDPCVRNSIYLNHKAPTLFATTFVSEAVHLKSLFLKNRGDVNKLLAAALSNCRQLTQLEARFCQPLTEASVNSLSSSKVISNLKYLSLEGTGVSANQPFIGVWRHVFSAALNLRHLNLFGCRFLEPEDLVLECSSRLLSSWLAVLS